MKEKYLHYLWKNKLIPFHKLTLNDQQSFKVIYPGDYNQYDSGPDFLNARVVIGDFLFVGNVEIHIRSKDWYNHRHHLDPAYNTVILHVVLEDNCEVFINDNPVPTLELKDQIDWQHFEKYKDLFSMNSEILCASQINELVDIFFISTLEKALYEKIERKNQLIKDSYNQSTDGEVLFHLMAKSMGSRVNRMPFEELANRLDIHKLKRIPKKDQRELIKITSGLFSYDEPESVIQYVNLLVRNKNILVEPLKTETWKFGGVRPANSPLLRIEQFSEIVAQCDFSTSFVYLNINELLTYFKGILSVNDKKINSKNRSFKMSGDFKNHVIINCFVPFMYWFGEKNNSPEIQLKAFELLEKLPAERNSIIDKWKKVKIVPKNAAQSQALLELFNNSCSLKKCLLCQIGNKLLSS